MCTGFSIFITKILIVLKSYLCLLLTLFDKIPNEFIVCVFVFNQLNKDFTQASRAKSEYLCVLFSSVR